MKKYLAATMSLRNSVKHNYAFFLLLLYINFQLVHMQLPNKFLKMYPFATIKYKALILSWYPSSASRAIYSFPTNWLWKMQIFIMHCYCIFLKFVSYQSVLIYFINFVTKFVTKNIKHAVNIKLNSSTVLPCQEITSSHP